MIPTVGRIVHLRRQEDPEGSQPNAAIICHVHNDRMVNIAWFDLEGIHRIAKRVLLLQGDEYDALGKDTASYWCEWPPQPKEAK